MLREERAVGERGARSKGEAVRSGEDEGEATGPCEYCRAI